eukprot:TRINITY_DN923_c0_g3_i1.p4 TRINITY_DN923_c0_g3~~TRINITY_DN923_c0_g3_i1.p4  ORF type:complete len:213 (-),score=-6.44 TRINITY_DN923_c0_g3_i1:4-642(-)
MQDHDHNDDDDHFGDMEGEVPDERNREQCLAHDPFLPDGFRRADDGVGDKLVRGRVVVAPRDVPVMDGRILRTELVAPDLSQRGGGRCIHHRPVDDGMDRGQAIGFVDDHVAVTVELRDIRLLPLLPGHELPVPVLLDHHDEIADIHVGDHAARFDRDDRRPGAADQPEGESDGTHDADHPEEVPGEGDCPVVTGAELGEKRSNIPGPCTLR